MRGRPFGPTRASVPVIGIGTWNMERDDRKGAIAAIRRAIELGMVHVDTAELYTPRQVALAFLTRHRSVFAIPKSSHAQHVDELAGADRVSLDDAALAAIEAAFPLAAWRGLPTL